MFAADDLADVDVVKELQSLAEHIGRMPTEEELVMYLNHPGDALNDDQVRGQVRRLQPPAPARLV
jgi:hypothetical protein